MSLALLSTDFFLMECGECGIAFHVPASWQRERRDNGKGWYCPNGHSRVYRESEVDRLKKKLREAEESKARHIQSRRWAEENARSARHGTAIAQGKLKAAKKRAAAGVCPCCKRSFKQLRRHMKTKHPKYTETLA